MAKRIDRFSVTLNRILKAAGMEGRLQEFRVLRHWDRAVGPAIARHARPKDLRAGRLTLVVDSPAWMQQLSLLRPEIREKLNSAIGRVTIREITLRLGEVEAPEGRKDEERPVPRKLAPDERARIEEAVAGIADDEVRRSLRSLIEKDVASRKK